MMFSISASINFIDLPDYLDYDLEISCDRSAGIPML